MRFLLALARANDVTTALGFLSALVPCDRLLGASLVDVPFVQDAVRAGRVFPALLAGCGALVVAPDWRQHERVGVRTAAGLALGRWIAGGMLCVAAGVAAGGAAKATAVLYVALGIAAALQPRHWWLALPPLLYLQLYLPAEVLPR